MMTNSWKLSRPVFGLLMYFTTRNVFAANETCSQVVKNNVTTFVNCTMNSTVQSTQTMVVFAANRSTIQGVHTTVAPGSGMSSVLTMEILATSMSKIQKLGTKTVGNTISVVPTLVPSAAQATTTSVGTNESKTSINQNFKSTSAIVPAPSLTSSPTLGTKTVGNTSSVVPPVASSTVVLATTAAPNTTASTTTAPNTTAPTTTSPTVNTENYPRTVKFEFPGNCTELYNSSTEKAFREHLKTSIASKANFNVSNMNDFNLTCGSIRVSFILTRDASNSSAPSVNDSIKSLSNLITSGNFNITLEDGGKLTADKTSLTIIIISPQPTVVPSTKAPTPKSTSTPKPTVGKAPTPTSSPLSTGAIIGIVIGCIVACLIILTVVYICCCRKNTVLNGESNELQQTSGKANLGHA